MLTVWPIINSQIKLVSKIFLMKKNLTKTTCVLLNLLKCIRLSLSMEGSQKSGNPRQAPSTTATAKDFNADTVGLINFHVTKYSTG
jgi:hypothetical protein